VTERRSTEQNGTDNLYDVNFKILDKTFHTWAEGTFTLFVGVATWKAEDCNPFPIKD